MKSGRLENRRLPVLSRAYILFAALIMLVAAVTILLYTYSSLQSRKVLAEARDNSGALSLGLFDIQDSYIASGESILRYLPDSQDPLGDKDFLDRLAMAANAVASDFARNRDLAQGYFFFLNAKQPDAHYELYRNIRTDTQQHISVIFGYQTAVERARIESVISSTRQPLWTTVNQPMNGIQYLICVVPLFYGDTYLGFSGLVVDTNTVKDTFTELKTDRWRYTFLLSSNSEVLAHDSLNGGERLEYADNKRFAPLAALVAERDSGYITLRDPIDSKVWIYAFARMPSGQVYVEAQQRARRVTGTNLLVLQMTLMAILATALVQNRGKTLFGSMADKILSGQTELHPTVQNSYRAMLALHIGGIGGIGSQLLFLTFSKNFGLETMLYALVFVALLFELRAYKKAVIPKWRLILLGILFLVLPVLAYVLDGFTMESGPLIWLLAAVVGSLFLVKRDIAKIVFYSFVIVLFLFVLLEIFFLGHPMPQRLMPMVGSLFFLGFSLFSAVGIYAQSSKDDYKLLEETFDRLKNAQSMLVQHEKMVTLGQLIAGVAHEINTPLGAIKASSETLNGSLERVAGILMRTGAGLDETDMNDFFRLMSMNVESIREMNSTEQARKARKPIREYISALGLENGDEISNRLIRLEICNMSMLKENEDILVKPKAALLLKLLSDLTPLISSGQNIQFAAAKAGKIIFALKSYSHTGISGDAASFNIAQSIDNVLTLYHNQLKQNIQLVKLFEEELPSISGDVDEISQVWTNLIHNAIQAMPDGGTLTIELCRDDNFVVARFRDTGVGIPREYLAKIFEPFFTTKPLGEGSGLGLDISRKIIMKHGGVIAAESDGNGSVFTVRLPSGIRQ